MKEIIINKQEDLHDLKEQESVTLIINIDYISAEDIWHIHNFWQILEENEYELSIRVKDEWVMDLLDLVWITNLYHTLLIK